LEVARIAPKRISSEGPTTSVTREVGATTYYMSKIEEGNIVLNISPDSSELPTLDMKEQS
jgi:hypothetical protein